MNQQQLNENRTYYNSNLNDHKHVNLMWIFFRTLVNFYYYSFRFRTMPNSTPRVSSISVEFEISSTVHVWLYACVTMQVIRRLRRIDPSRLLFMRKRYMISLVCKNYWIVKVVWSTLNNHEFEITLNQYFDVLWFLRQSNISFADLIFRIKLRNETFCDEHIILAVEGMCFNHVLSFVVVKSSFPFENALLFELNVLCLKPYNNECTATSTKKCYKDQLIEPYIGQSSFSCTQIF